MHKIKNDPISNDDVVNKEYVDNSILAKQDKTDNALDTTDKTVVGAINEINDSLLDNVTFSADYKNIIINRKSGTNPYTIPIASIIHNAKIIELNDIDATNIGDGKTLVYDGATKKHKYVDSTGTDELVKMDSTTDAKHLSELIDKSTIVNDGGILKVKKLDGQNVTIAEINYLKGLTMNVMDLVNAFANGGVKVLNTPVNTHADLSTLDRSTFLDGISYIVYVLADETHSGAKTTYLCDKTSETFFGNADSQRNFITNPIDLANEVTGKLDASNIDVDALWKLLTINDTYKTLTTKDEVFGTHGAKALYDELVADMSKKANATDLTSHTSDTGIHITTAERTKWNNVDNKVDKTDITTTIDNTSTDAQIPSARAVLNLKTAKRMNEGINPENYEVGDWYAEGYYGVLLSTSDGHPCSEWHIGYSVTGFKTSEGKGYKIILAITMNGDCYVKVQKWDTWTSWKKLCTTSVADVKPTTITPTFPSTVTSGKTKIISYSIKNGWANITIIMQLIASPKLDWTSIATELPKPDKEVHAAYGGETGINNTNVALRLKTNGTLDMLVSSEITKSDWWNLSFSYPVAEQ